MSGSPWLAALCGALLGAASGGLSRLALKKVVRAADNVFYGVFVGGIFARLGLLAASLWLLRKEKYIIIISFAAGLVIAQTLIEAFPIKHGPKADS